MIERVIHVGYLEPTIPVVPPVTAPVVEVEVDGVSLFFDCRRSYLARNLLIYSKFGVSLPSAVMHAPFNSSVQTDDTNDDRSSEVVHTHTGMMSVFNKWFIGWWNG